MTDKKYKLFHGDCLDVMRGMEPDSVDSIVTDPPAGIAFMGKAWDKDKGGRETWIDWMRQVAEECKRVIKPGGYALVWAIPRTSHWTGMAWELAGWEPRDKIYHAFGSGFPKSLDVGKKIDQISPRLGQFTEFAKHFSEKIQASGKSQKEISIHFPSKTGGLTGCVWNWANGANVPTVKQWQILKELLNLSDEYLPLIERIEAEREVVGKHEAPAKSIYSQSKNTLNQSVNITAPATLDAKKWDGWGTALKPAIEEWWIFRKPLSEKTVAENVLKWGTGGVNIDGCRVGTEEIIVKQVITDQSMHHNYGDGCKSNGVTTKSQGRYPSHLILDGSEEVRAVFPETHGHGSKTHSGSEKGMFNWGKGSKEQAGGDSGNASRYFKSCPFDEEDFQAQRLIYQAKANGQDRNEGCEDLEVNFMLNDDCPEEIKEKIKNIICCGAKDE